MFTYAIVRTGAKQYRVEPDSILEIELLELPEKGKEVSLQDVLLIQDGKDVHVGTPVLKGASIVCENLGEFRAPKVVSYKYRRRKATKKIRGHRQDLLRLKVKKIVAPKG